jgi:hypothetical protein
LPWHDPNLISILWIVPLFTRFVPLASLGLSLAFGLTLAPLQAIPIQATPLLVQTLPASVSSLVRQDLARRLGVPVDQLRIVTATSQTWSDGCLGLAQPQEVCTQALVPGWRVRVALGERLWTYRANQSGSSLRLENQRPSVILPSPVAQAVMAQVSRRSGLDPKFLKLTTAERRTWSDSCLGLGGTNLLCTEVLVPGWQVAVESERQRWIYRTDLSGNQVVLDPAASRVMGRLIQPPTQMAANQLPPPLPENVRFRALIEGGLLNRPSETRLYADGRITETRTNAKGETQTRQVRQLKPELLSQFEQLLQTRQFSRFHPFHYPAPQGAADFMTVTLSSPTVNVRYSDIAQFQLPEDLQQVIQAWQTLVESGKLP